MASLVTNVFSVTEVRQLLAIHQHSWAPVVRLFFPNMPRSEVLDVRQLSAISTWRRRTKHLNK